MPTFERENRAHRFDVLERLIRNTLQTLSTTKGRARIDQEGLGAAKMLLEKTLASVEVIRADVMSPWPKRCGCGKEYDQTTWAELPLVGTQPDYEGGRQELRNCVCGSTISIPLPQPTDSDSVSPGVDPLGSATRGSARPADPSHSKGPLGQDGATPC